MALRWITTLILFLQPEDSYRWADDKYLERPASRSMEVKSNISAKALIWILIAILTGLVIGQLH